MRRYSGEIRRYVPDSLLKAEGAPLPIAREISQDDAYEVLADLTRTSQTNGIAAIKAHYRKTLLQRQQACAELKDQRSPMMMNNAFVLDPQKDGKVDVRGSAQDRTLRTILRMIDGELTGSEHFLGGLAIFEPGTTVSFHSHPDAEEVNVVLAGQGLFITDQGARPIKLGDWQFIPKGVPHCHENTGDTPLTILWLYSPPSTTLPK